jgi:hypothetical protein
MVGRPWLNHKPHQPPGLLALFISLNDTLAYRYTLVSPPLYAYMERTHRTGAQRGQF